MEQRQAITGVVEDRRLAQCENFLTLTMMALDNSAEVGIVVRIGRGVSPCLDLAPESTGISFTTQGVQRHE